MAQPRVSFHENLHLQQLRAERAACPPTRPTFTGTVTLSSAAARAHLPILHVEQSTVAAAPKTRPPSIRDVHVEARRQRALVLAQATVTAQEEAAARAEELRAENQRELARLRARTLSDCERRLLALADPAIHAALVQKQEEARARALAAAEAALALQTGGHARAHRYGGGGTATQAPLLPGAAGFSGAAHDVASAGAAQSSAGGAAGPVGGGPSGGVDDVDDGVPAPAPAPALADSLSAQSGLYSPGFSAAATGGASAFSGGSPSFGAASPGTDGEPSRAALLHGDHADREQRARALAQIQTITRASAPAVTAATAPRGTFFTIDDDEGEQDDGSAGGEAVDFLSAAHNARYTDTFAAEEARREASGRGSLAASAAGSAQSLQAAAAESALRWAQQQPATIAAVRPQQAAAAAAASSTRPLSAQPGAARTASAAGARPASARQPAAAAVVASGDDALPALTGPAAGLGNATDASAQLDPAALAGPNPLIDIRATHAAVLSAQSAWHIRTHALCARRGGVAILPFEDRVARAVTAVAPSFQVRGLRVWVAAASVRADDEVGPVLARAAQSIRAGTHATALAPLSAASSATASRASLQLQPSAAELRGEIARLVQQRSRALKDALKRVARGAAHTEGGNSAASSAGSTALVLSGTAHPAAAAGDDTLGGGGFGDGDDLDDEGPETAAASSAATAVSLGSPEGGKAAGKSARPATLGSVPSADFERWLATRGADGPDAAGAGAAAGDGVWASPLTGSRSLGQQQRARAQHHGGSALTERDQAAIAAAVTHLATLSAHASTAPTRGVWCWASRCAFASSEVLEEWATNLALMDIGVRQRVPMRRPHPHAAGRDADLDVEEDETANADAEAAVRDPLLAEPGESALGARILRALRNATASLRAQSAEACARIAASCGTLSGRLALALEDAAAEDVVLGVRIAPIAGGCAPWADVVRAVEDEIAGVGAGAAADATAAATSSAAAEPVVPLYIPTPGGAPAAAQGLLPTSKARAVAAHMHALGAIDKATGLTVGDAVLRSIAALPMLQAIKKDAAAAAAASDAPAKTATLVAVAAPLPTATTLALHRGVLRAAQWVLAAVLPAFAAALAGHLAAVAEERRIATEAAQAQAAAVAEQERVALLHQQALQRARDDDGGDGDNNDTDAEARGLATSSSVAALAALQQGVWDPLGAHALGAVVQAVQAADAAAAAPLVAASPLADPSASPSLVGTPVHGSSTLTSKQTVAPLSPSAAPALQAADAPLTTALSSAVSTLSAAQSSFQARARLSQDLLRREAQARRDAQLISALNAEAETVREELRYKFLSKGLVIGQRIEAGEGLRDVLRQQQPPILVRLVMSAVALLLGWRDTSWERIAGNLRTYDPLALSEAGGGSEAALIRGTLLAVADGERDGGAHRRKGLLGEVANRHKQKLAGQLPGQLPTASTAATTATASVPSAPGNGPLTRQLTALDPTSVPRAVLQQVRPLLAERALTVPAVAQCSQSVALLLAWVLAAVETWEAWLAAYDRLRAAAVAVVERDKAANPNWLDAIEGALPPAAAAYAPPALPLAPPPASTAVTVAAAEPIAAAASHGRRAVRGGVAAAAVAGSDKPFLRAAAQRPQSSGQQ